MSVQVMGLREFLRGGYRTLDGVTVITHHGHPIATWTPHTERVWLEQMIERLEPRTGRKSRGR